MSFFLLIVLQNKTLLSNCDGFQLAESIINRFFQSKKNFFDLNSISFKSYKYRSKLIVPLYTKRNNGFTTVQNTMQK